MSTVAAMPRISSFYGITVFMYYDEHGVPHFHAEYAGTRASIAVGTLAVLAGSLPPRALRLVQEWAEEHEAELAANWELARAEAPLNQIPPLT